MELGTIEWYTVHLHWQPQSNSSCVAISADVLEELNQLASKYAEYAYVGCMYVMVCFELPHRVFVLPSQTEDILQAVIGQKYSAPRCLTA